MPILSKFRKQIDDIDDQLIELLSKRFEVVKQIGKYKKTINLPPLQPARWEEVLEKRIKKANENNIDSDFIVDIWNRIHEYALNIEK